jgi:Xaa-Pro aminopeptidase
MDRSRRRFLEQGAAVAAAGILARCGAGAPGPGREAPAAPSPSPSLPPPIPAERYVRRRADLASRMRSEGFDRLVATPGPALAYLTGAALYRSERLIALVMDRDGGCRCLGPAFEKERLARSGLPGELSTWEEHEDPIPRLAALLAPSDPAPRIAVEGTTWFDTLMPLSRRIPAARIASATPLISPLRMKKDPEELALMQSAVDITLDLIQRVLRDAKEGDTEQDLLGRATAFAAAAGASLDGLVQFGANSAVPHGGSGETRLRASDVILFDMVAEVRGYHSDISRTFTFGAPTPRFQQIYRTVREAQEAALRAARPGILARDLDEAARAVIRRNGFGRYFTHRLGHGLGLEGHEPPYLVGGSEAVLEAGMTMTVEPGIYLPGEFGVRLEDDIVITDYGPRILSAPRQPPA